MSKPPSRFARLALTVSLLATLAPLAERASAAGDDGWTLTIDAWQRPRDARSVLAEPTLRAAVGAWLHQGEHAEHPPLLVIGHAGGEDGAVWAAELRDWLIALAIPAEAIELRPGGAPPDALQLRVESR